MWLRDWRARRKLARRRCAECEQTLPDNNVDGVCSDQCGEKRLLRTAW